MNRFARTRAGRRAIGVGATTIGAVVTAWLVGFVWFVTIAGRHTPPPPHADGIVALTGGADRVQTALRLLEQDRADRLLVSGIGGGAAFRDLAAKAGIHAAPLAGRVTLGRGATSTRGNAEETAAWVHEEGLRSLIVVTAYYHMPRALTELGRAIPGVTLYPAPVSPSGPNPARGLKSLSMLRLMLGEYAKLVAAELWLTELAPGHAPVLSMADHGRQG